MTPAARVQAAIEVLEDYLQGTALEAAFLRWSRKSRFAGSKDRAAIRDLIYDAVRRRRSLGAWPEGNARLWAARLLLQQGMDLDDVFGQPPYGPVALSDEERKAALHSDMANAPDVPEWIEAQIRQDYSQAAQDILASYSTRAPVTLRVNRRQGTTAEAMALLRADGIAAASNPVAPFALTVTDGARGIAQSQAFTTGWVELQDASSQALCEEMDIDGPILDFCAGGGGKALALADRGADVTAHDIDPKRMSDIPNRAQRAGVQIKIADIADLKKATFAAVLCDLPCSGSGTWRRTPDAKWRFREDDLEQLIQTQRKIMTQAAAYIRPGGCLYVATCSIFQAENNSQLQWAIKNLPDSTLVEDLQRVPTQGSDGFYAFKLRIVK